jgi:hypothetical protein
VQKSEVLKGYWHKPDEPEPNKKKCPTDDRIKIRWPLLSVGKIFVFIAHISLIETI